MNECKCIVKKTNQKCKHPIKTDRGYCGIHKNCKNEYLEHTAVHKEKKIGHGDSQCKCTVAKTKDKCKHPIKTDRGYCNIHKNCKNEFTQQSWLHEIPFIIKTSINNHNNNSNIKKTSPVGNNIDKHIIPLTIKNNINDKNINQLIIKNSIDKHNQLIIKNNIDKHITPLIIKNNIDTHITPLTIKNKYRNTINNNNTHSTVENNINDKNSIDKHINQLIIKNNIDKHSINNNIIHSTVKKTSPVKHRTSSSDSSGIPQILFTGPDAPDMSDTKISYLVNNYNLLRTGCDEECTLRGRPVVILTGKFHDKKLRNVNPFRFLNRDVIDKYNLDIQLLIEVCDKLIAYTPEKLFESIELLLTSYYRKNRIIDLLYASCLSGIFLWNILDYRFYPLKKNWAKSANNVYTEMIKPRNILKNYCWLFFDMIMNINKIIYLSIYNKQNPGEAVYKVGEILEYAESATDGYMMNYYSETKLKNNCVLSSLMEACTLQAFGVDPSEITLRLEAPIYVDKAGKEIKNIYHRALIPAGKNKKGAEFASHFALEYRNVKLRSNILNGYCTEHTLNFLDNKIEIAMSILYIDISIFKRMLRDNKDDLLNYQPPPNGLFLKLFNEVGLIYYNLRIILEYKLGKMIKKEVIDNEYFLDSKRDHDLMFNL